jgi:hypothetical protein
MFLRMFASLAETGVVPQAAIARSLMLAKITTMAIDERGSANAMLLMDPRSRREASMRAETKLVDVSRHRQAGREWRREGYLPL